MAGRFVHFLVAGGAIFSGMVVQGDIDLGLHPHDGKIVKSGDRQVEVDPATKRALAAAVAELVRAEGRLVSAKLDDDTPAAVIAQVQRRRDDAREAVERIADEAKAETRGNRDALRQNIRENVREAVRS